MPKRSAQSSKYRRISGCSRVGLGQSGFEREGIGVEVRRHVAGGAGVGVAPPGARRCRRLASKSTKSRRPDLASLMARPSPPAPAPMMATCQCGTRSASLPAGLPLVATGALTAPLPIASATTCPAPPRPSAPPGRRWDRARRPGAPGRPAPASVRRPRPARPVGAGRCRGRRRATTGRSPRRVRTGPASAPAREGAVPSKATSSTMPLSGAPASPRNTERRVRARRPEEFGPWTLEFVVHEDREAEPVAPEHQTGLDVTRRDRRVVHLRHRASEEERRGPESVTAGRVRSGPGPRAKGER